MIHLMISFISLLNINMMDAIKTYYSQDGKIRLTIGIMESDFMESPREEYNIAEFTTREHRYYKLPKEFDFDWDAYDDGDMENVEYMDRSYHLFFLDCYEHGNMHWSLSGGGIQCQFDTARRAGLMRVDRNEVEDRKEALKIVESELKRYNQWLSGEIYEWRLERLTKWTSEDGREREEREFVDSCGGFYDVKDAIDDAKELTENDEIVIEDGEN